MSWSIGWRLLLIAALAFGSVGVLADHDWVVDPEIGGGLKLELRIEVEEGLLNAAQFDLNAANAVARRAGPALSIDQDQLELLIVPDGDTTAEEARAFMAYWFSEYTLVDARPGPAPTQVFALTPTARESRRQAIISGALDNLRRYGPDPNDIALMEVDPDGSIEIWMTGRVDLQRREPSGDYWTSVHSGSLTAAPEPPSAAPHEPAAPQPKRGTRRRPEAVQRRREPLETV